MTNWFLKMAAVWSVLLAVMATGLAKAEDQGDPAQRLLGKWVSQDNERLPLAFDADGTIHYGWRQPGGGFVVVKGTYTLANNGRVEAVVQNQGAKLTTWFNFKGDELQKPEGPKSKIWRKEKVATK